MDFIGILNLDVSQYGKWEVRVLNPCRYHSHPFRQGLFSLNYVVTVIVERIYVALHKYLSTALVYAVALLR